MPKELNIQSGSKSVDAEKSGQATTVPRNPKYSPTSQLLREQSRARRNSVQQKPNKKLLFDGTRKNQERRQPTWTRSGNSDETTTNCILLRKPGRGTLGSGKYTPDKLLNLFSTAVQCNARSQRSSQASSLDGGDNHPQEHKAHFNAPRQITHLLFPQQSIMSSISQFLSEFSSFTIRP